MRPRISNPLSAFPDGVNVIQAMRALKDAMVGVGVPATTLELVALRAGQIDGRGVCVDLHAGELRARGETDERLFATAAWREAPWYTDAERAAPALAEAATRLSDREDPVSDAVWGEAAPHYDEPALAALVTSVAVINYFNRLSVPTRQVAGSWRR